MPSEAAQLSEHVLEVAAKKMSDRGDGNYYHRVSAISRCLRDMVLHAYAEPWSNEPQAKWGDTYRFNQGHDVEDRVIKGLQDAGVVVSCQQLKVQATSPMGKPISGHIDGIVLVPHHLPLGGKWFLMDVKSAGAFAYKTVLEKDQPKLDNMRQVSIYTQSIVNDDNYPEVKGIKVCDLEFDDYEFGGGMLCYFSLDRPVKGYGPSREDQPKMHFITFDVDPHEVEMYLDVFDEVDIHKREGTIPPIPSVSDEMVWGRQQKDGSYKAIRCNPRWCRRYDVCQGIEKPIQNEVRELLWER